jgi:hypothetical protein
MTMQASQDSSNTISESIEGELFAFLGAVQSQTLPRSKALVAQLCPWAVLCVIGRIVDTDTFEPRTAAAGCDHQVLLDFGLQLAQQDAGNDAPQSCFWSGLLGL